MTVSSANRPMMLGWSVCRAGRMSSEVPLMRLAARMRTAASINSRVLCRNPPHLVTIDTPLPTIADIWSPRNGPAWLNFTNGVKCRDPAHDLPRPLVLPVGRAHERDIRRGVNKDAGVWGQAIAHLSP